jgi:hypothetical protein
MLLNSETPIAQAVPQSLESVEDWQMQLVNGHNRLQS